MKADCADVLEAISGLSNDSPWPPEIRQRAQEHLCACDECWSSLLALVERDEALLRRQIREAIETIDWHVVWRRIRAGL